MTTLREAAQQALEAMLNFPDDISDEMFESITALKAALAGPQTADDLREPKNGAKWRVEWWNESCRMMLPEGRKLDSFVSYKNGTLQITIKRTQP